MKKIGIALGLLIIGLFFGFLIGRSTAPLQSVVVSGASDAQKQVASLMIDYGDGHVKTYSEIPVVVGETLIQLLEKQTKAVTLNFTTKKYDSLGTLVETIGNKTNGAENKYWQYWVNNQSMPYGADQYKVQPGDVIEWKFLNYK
jgi:hypothetical protein